MYKNSDKFVSSIQVTNNKYKNEQEKCLSNIANILQQSKNENDNKKSIKSAKKEKYLNISRTNNDSIENSCNKVENETRLLVASKKQNNNHKHKMHNISSLTVQKNIKTQKNKLKRISQKSKVTINNLKKNKIKRLQNKTQLQYKQESKNKNEKCLKQTSKLNSKSTLRERMENKLKASRFRYLNEQLYTHQGQEAKKIFQSDPESFYAYHEGFRQQVSRWPMNPLDKIIESIKKMPENYVIADFGCGEAKLSSSVPHKVYSFDLVVTVPGVVACDMAHSNLSSGSVDVIVFCLSLMGTNLRDYLIEANRVLKIGGIMKIAEVESRFQRINTFIEELWRFGFKLLWKDLSHNLFYFMDFKKERNIKNKNKLPNISLHPCLYKKR